MIGSYVKTAARIILRNRLFSFINIVGLTISMAVGLLMIALLWDMHRYDKFNENYDRILVSSLIALPATQLFFIRYALDKYAVNAPIE